MNREWEAQVANTIHEQLRSMGGVKVMSWGYHAPQIVPVSVLREWGIDNASGALKFRVRGHHFSGNVIVALNGSDYYDIYYGSVRGGKFTRKLPTDRDVFVGDMVDTIDEKIERIPEYAA